MSGSITISPILDLRSGKQYDFAVSILGKSDQTPFPKIKSKHLLQLQFDDVCNSSAFFKAPSLDDIKKIIDFSLFWSGNGNILIHCKAGTSRSPAAGMIAAMAIEKCDLALKIGGGRPYFRPNKKMLDLADMCFSELGGGLSLCDMEASIQRIDKPTDVKSITIQID